MATRISSTRNRTSRVEYLGGALVRFVRGIADLEGTVRPGVLAAAERLGYRISDDDPDTPAPKRRPRTPRTETSVPTTGAVPDADALDPDGQADELATLAEDAVLGGPAPRYPEP